MLPVGWFNAEQYSSGAVYDPSPQTTYYVIWLLRPDFCGREERENRETTIETDERMFWILFHGFLRARSSAPTDILPRDDVKKEHFCGRGEKKLGKDIVLDRCELFSKTNGGRDLDVCTFIGLANRTLPSETVIVWPNLYSEYIREDSKSFLLSVLSNINVCNKKKSILTCYCITRYTVVIKGEGTE